MSMLDYQVAPSEFMMILHRADGDRPQYMHNGPCNPIGCEPYPPTGTDGHTYESIEAECTAQGHELRCQPDGDSWQIMHGEPFTAVAVCETNRLRDFLTRVHRRDDEIKAAQGSGQA